MTWTHGTDGGRDDAAARRSGLLIGLVSLPVTALPVYMVASLAHASFSGCWLACGGTTDPILGTVWVVVAAAILATPIGVALRVAHASWMDWATTALAIAAAAGAWVVFSLDPANADFFIHLGE